MDWNGAFAPTLSKSIGRTTYIPICRMTASDWKLLDWNALRNAAKNDIVAVALIERIMGFLHVAFVQKGSQAAGYNLVVAESMIGGLDMMMTNPPIKNTMDDPELNQVTEEFDKLLERAQTLSLLYGKVALGLLIAKSIRKALLKDKIDDCLKALVNKIEEGDWTDYEASDLLELDIILTWALSTAHFYKIPGMQDQIDEWEQILGEADDKGLL